MRKPREIMSGDVEHALVRLWSDELSEAEAEAIHARVREDPRFREELHGAMEVLASMEALADDSENREILRDFRRILHERRSKRRLALGIAAGVLVAVGAGLTHFSPWSGPDDSPLQKHFITRVGEQQTLELDDGSVVTLNTGGQLAVDYSGPARRIVLQRGEAYFDVTEDPRRPFTVDLGVRSVTAVGTAFNIRKSPERYQVAVVEGAVAFHADTDDAAPSPPPVSVDGRAARISAPGQRRVEAGWVAEFDLSADVLTAFRPESMDRYRDWRSGMLSFYREPLYEVIKELNRYSRKKILIEDASVMELNVYTAVNVHEIDSALEGMELVLPIEVVRYYDRIVITASAEN